MKKVLLLVLLLAMMTSQVFAEETQTHGSLLRDLGIINGENGDLNEDGLLKREELVAILVRIVDTGDVVLPAEPYFTDVPKDNWAFEVLEKAHVLGITDGVSPNTFGFGQIVDQQQATTFILKTLGYKPNWDTVIEDAKDKYLIDLTDTPDQFVRKHMFELTNDAMLADFANGNGILLDRVISEKTDEKRRNYIINYSHQLSADRTAYAEKKKAEERSVPYQGKDLIKDVMLATEDENLKQIVDTISATTFYVSDEKGLFDFVGATELAVFSFEEKYVETAQDGSTYNVQSYYRAELHDFMQTSVLIESSEGMGGEVWENEVYHTADNAFIYKYDYPYYTDNGMIQKPGYILILKNADGTFSLSEHREKHIVKAEIADTK